MEKINTGSPVLISSSCYAGDPWDKGICWEMDGGGTDYPIGKFGIIVSQDKKFLNPRSTRYLVYVTNRLFSIHESDIHLMELK